MTSIGLGPNTIMRFLGLVSATPNTSIGFLSNIVVVKFLSAGNVGPYSNWLIIYLEG
jgi:hypothetical protein